MIDESNQMKLKLVSGVILSAVVAVSCVGRAETTVPIKPVITGVGSPDVSETNLTAGADSVGGRVGVKSKGDGTTGVVAISGNSAWLGIVAILFAASALWRTGQRSFEARYHRTRDARLEQEYKDRQRQTAVYAGKPTQILEIQT